MIVVRASSPAVLKAAGGTLTRSHMRSPWVGELGVGDCGGEARKAEVKEQLAETHLHF